MNNFGNNNRKQLGKQFEEQFKNKFENAQFTPPAHLWEQIDAALDAKPWYKRPLFYWTSGLVAALLLVVMFWFTLVYEGTNTPANTTIVNTDKIENTNSDNINSDKSIDNNTNNSSSTNKGIRTIQTPNDTGFNAIETDPVQEKELVINSNTKTTNSNSITSDKNATYSNNKTENNLENNTEKQNSSVITSTTIKDKEKNKESSKNNISNRVIVDNTKNINTELITFKEIDWSKYLPIGNPYFEKEIIVKFDSTNQAIANNQNAIETIKDAKKSSGIAITFGINHTQGIYKPTFRTDSIYSGLTVIEAVKSNLAETLPQLSISGTYQQTGFDVALAFGKNKRWSINTGIGKGKATYSFGSTNYIRYVGSNIPVSRDSLIQLPINQVEVNYDWLQVPIAIGYQFGETRAKKFSGFAQLGTAIEFLSSYSYTSANPNFTYAIGNHRTTNTQVWTQAGINFHITNRWAIWGGGTYKSSLSSLINENGVTFSSQAYGWQVGTRFTVFNSGK